LSIAQALRCRVRTAYRFGIPFSARLPRTLVAVQVMLHEVLDLNDALAVHAYTVPDRLQMEASKARKRQWVLR